ncbi:DUF1836 domain-containing protein [Alkalihalobacillus sp. AL-G]|uniref:DUF1836 domain-containing protein n=1 Tax=Alkalihalobacillus sp. AL-G TaxID=2926399 RepID=UPI0027298495|nr:DUF1836 domain-containing protein [Alkalihalobacillus sp. AL-G]WLD94180.1 DUF1836 domain-containing protein [Alkalihalobacillus sp. AL-G]
MHPFTLTRKEMAELLLSLQNNEGMSPFDVIKSALVDSNQSDSENSMVESAMNSSLPGIFEKLMKISKRDVGLSINEIVSLGNQIEYSSFSTSAVQNWVKRDVRGLIGSPQKGKKYSLEQAAILFIVEDLKSTLDFVSIRNLLTLIFNNIEDRQDDLIDPLYYYSTYSLIFEELDLNKDYVVDVDFRIHHGDRAEMLIFQKAEEKLKAMDFLNEKEKTIIQNALVISTLSVQTSYFQSVSRQFLNSTLFI